MDQTIADAKVRAALIGLESRTQALFIYGVTALGVGLAMFFTGVPGDVEQYLGAVARGYFGGPLSVAGIALIAGSFVANEHRWAWWSALVGFSVFTIWAVAMATAYAIIAIERGVEFAWPWDVIDPEMGRLYITVFYQGVACLTLMHIVTLLRLGRPPR